MTLRIDNPQALFPAGMKAMIALETALHQTGLDPVLLELVKLRASQNNRCAYCIHMRTTALRKRGVEEMKLYLLTARRESNLFTPRERAALGWTEALTRVAETAAPDGDYTDFAFEFTEEEQVQLTYAIGAINVWNRLQVGVRTAHPVDAREAA
ncbi:carboxymuconolactone decarboxylase family protein [Croceibacterium ferulae]|uniref:carboxymuconolactone decarboxylase family protein n=1 Tax=Croceibacterium ferulae TaxID=1854641 RepID=UPI000EACB3F0|nr:carboxymuconolactone decarboxylase family protein [Croceibacterium ferulae]